MSWSWKEKLKRCLPSAKLMARIARDRPDRQRCLYHNGVVVACVASTPPMQARRQGGGVGGSLDISVNSTVTLAVQQLCKRPDSD
eukprot:3905182-Heterocapsa_arctica.AAC.1